MDDILLSLEKEFFRYEKISDRSYLDAVLHRRFCEMGASGRIFGREETIEALLSAKKNRPIAIFNFRQEKVGDRCYIVHYMTKSGGRLFFRTSVWTDETGRLQLFFHQASEMKIPVSLVEY